MRMPTPTLDAIQAMLARRENDAAFAAANAFLAQPGLPTKARAAALLLRARANESCGRNRDAIADLQAVGALVPDNAAVFAELGVLLAQAGDARPAAVALSRAVQLDPDKPRPWNNFGNALRSMGEHAAALRAYERAVQLRPDYAIALASMGVVLEETGRWQEAEQMLERALGLDARLVPALIALGSIKRDKGAIEESTALFTRATQADPKDAAPWIQLARACNDVDQTGDARAAFNQAALRDPGLLRAHLGRCLSLPNVYPDAQAMHAERAGYAAGLSELEATLPAHARGLSHERRLNGLRWSNFLLGYQGEDDRHLQQRYGTLVSGIIRPADAPVRPAGRKRLRVGVVSAFFRDSTVGRYFASWVTDLDRARFEVVVYHLNHVLDPVADELRSSADLFRNCPRWTASSMEATIRADAPDIIIYPELGMDATTFVLSSLRLAPLQCAGWGHPVTTGMPSIDVFLSSGAMEGPDADAHYSEELVRLPGLGTRYVMRPAPAGATREALKLPAGRPLLLCPQSHFKILPGDDALIARVMTAIPDSALVLFQGRNPVITQRFLARLQGTLQAAGVTGEGRVVVLPTLRHDDYLRVNTLCDLMLDTTRWSGGNTALDAIASGLPVVTMPGRFMRARQTAGMYALMGVEGLTVDSADAYVATAVRLVQDGAFRAQAKAAIVAGRPAIFDDPAPLRALNQFLQDRASSH
jgi:CRISPR-associated protein Csy1